VDLPLLLPVDETKKKRSQDFKDFPLFSKNYRGKLLDI
jgi:hypothetical protein